MPLPTTLAEAEAHNARMQQQARARLSAPERPVLLAGLPKRSVTLILPFPPTLNHSGADGFRGGRKTPEYKLFMDQVALAVTKARPVNGRLEMEIVAFPPDARKRDLDNLIKPICDALQRAGLFADDEQIDRITITRVRGTKRGVVSVTVNEL